MGRKNLEHGVENDVDETEKPGTRGWRMMWMGRRNLEEGVENDVDGTEKPGTRGGE